MFASTATVCTFACASMRTGAVCVLALGAVTTLAPAAARRDGEGGRLRAHEKVSRRYLQEDVFGG